jgi:hypothetical protein
MKSSDGGVPLGELRIKVLQKIKLFEKKKKRRRSDSPAKWRVADLRLGLLGYLPIFLRKLLPYPDLKNFSRFNASDFE